MPLKTRTCRPTFSKHHEDQSACKIRARLRYHISYTKRQLNRDQAVYLDPASDDGMQAVPFTKFPLSKATRACRAECSMVLVPVQVSATSKEENSNVETHSC